MVFRICKREGTIECISGVFLEGEDRCNNAFADVSGLLMEGPGGLSLMYSAIVCDDIGLEILHLLI